MIVTINIRAKLAINKKGIQLLTSTIIFAPHLEHFDLLEDKNVYLYICPLPSSGRKIIGISSEL